ncbi:hypothetical protein C1646_758162 [Rhizophagus diaphanus]|nr:hypothetical protein C1646_758162 [Rhizophagus diaphanus] [Rhizophagus sp. MUCL 43196]
MISQLIEASITRSPLCTLKVCFNSGKTRTLAIVIASVLVWQYTVSLSDLYLQLTAVGKFKRGMTNPGKALQIYRNTSNTFQIWNNNDGVYLLQAPPSNTSYAYSGTGNTQAVIADVNVTSEINDPITNTVTTVTTLNPLHAIVTIRYGIETTTEYDPEFYLTNSQQFALSVASSESKMISRAIDDVEDIAHNTGSSILFANAFAQQWAQATIARFSSSAVQANGEANGEGNGEGYGYVLEVVKEQTFAPLSAVLRLLYQALFGEHHMENACSKSLSDQAMRIKEVECNIKLVKGHFNLTNRVIYNNS